MGEQKNQWHPGFAAAIRMELKDNRDDLEFEDEHNISHKPLQIDLLIIKNEKNVTIKNRIGKIFRRYNIIEYKSPDDEMGIDVFYKVSAYACLYKTSSDVENGYPAQDITITMIRHRYPRVLIKYLRENGCAVIREEPGIYYITGNVLFRMQIIVSGELGSTGHIWLTSLQSGISEDTYQKLLLSVQELDSREKEQYGEAILEVVSKANETNLNKWKGENNMTSPTLERIMAPELEASRQEGERKGKILTYAEFGLSVEEIATRVSVPVEEVRKVLG